MLVYPFFVLIKSVLTTKLTATVLNSALFIHVICTCICTGFNPKILFPLEKIALCDYMEHCFIVTLIDKRVCDYDKDYIQKLFILNEL